MNINNGCKETEARVPVEIALKL